MWPWTQSGKESGKGGGEQGRREERRGQQGTTERRVYRTRATETRHRLACAWLHGRSLCLVLHITVWLLTPALVPTPAPGPHSSTCFPLQLQMWPCALTFYDQSMHANIFHSPLPRGFASFCSGSY